VVSGISSVGANGLVASLPLPARLAVGDLLVARVVAVESDQAVLQFGRQQFTARGVVGLQVGQEARLLVAQADAGGVRLRLVGPTVPAGPPRAAPGRAPTAPATPALPGWLTVPDEVLSIGLGLDAWPAAPAPPPPPRLGRAPAAPGQPESAPAESTLEDALPSPVIDRGQASDRRLASPRLASLAGTPAPPSPGLAGLVLTAYARVASGLATSRPATANQGQTTSSSDRLDRPDRPALAAGAPAADSWIDALIEQVRLPDLPVNRLLLSQLASGGQPTAADVQGLRAALTELAPPPTDLAVLNLLDRLGLPPTPTTIRLAARLTLGQHQPAADWSAALGELEQLARQADQPAATPLAQASRAALIGWSPPSDPDPADLARWLRRVVGQVGLPTEARLGGSAGAEGGISDFELGDARQTLQSLWSGARQLPAVDQQRVGEALERARDAVQTEQLLNAAPGSEREPRFLVFTLPVPDPDAPRRTMQLAVRERPADQAGPTPPTELVSIKLELPRLGPLRVSLAIRDGSIACRFHAGSAFAAELLRAGSGELATSLRALGFGRTSVDASAATPDLAPANLPAVLAHHAVEAQA
jgi:flagellar hook-length control protein FliK